MGTVTEVKTGTDFTSEINLTVEGEVVTNLPQIFVQYYYVDSGGRNVPFSFFAKDLGDQAIIDRAAALNVTVRQMDFDGEKIVNNIPESDTDTLIIEEGKTVEVFAEISYRDANGKVGKFTEGVVDAAGQPVLGTDGKQLECDLFIVNMCKSVTQDWLVT